ncbi:MAG: hypothetical protein AAGF75_08530 [Cyanobacteria bacterium P01_H01_bin.130]
MSALWWIGVPLFVLGGAAILVPVLVIPRGTRSHVRVAVGIGGSALAMIALGILVYLMFDDRDLATGLEIKGVGGMVVLALGGSLRSALLWGPLLALHWFYAAQRVERLRGEDKVRDGV